MDDELGNRDPRTENVLKHLSVKFEYDADYPLHKLILDEETQVRSGDNQAPKKEVARYLDLLKAGATFPPIVILKGGRVVDGNTRWKAFTANKRTFIPAYVCDISSPALAKRIGVELNAVHGRRMEKAELTSWLSSGNGTVTEDDALRITGWSGATIRRIRGALQFEARRTKLGVALKTSLPDDVRAVLNGVTNPEAFAMLTALADEAGLKAAEARHLVRQVNEAALTDPEAAKRIIQLATIDNGQRIEDRRAGLRVTTPLYQQMAMHLGWVLGKGAPGLHDASPYTGTRSKALLEDALAVIKEALERY